MMFTTINIILLAALLLCLLIQLLYWWTVLAKPYYQQRKENKRVGEGDSDNESLRPVSVVICTQDNDEEVLREHLIAILEQDYPRFEVIVVDDNLPSECNDLLKQLRMQYRNFYFTRIPDGTKNLSRKKLGLTLGIKAAQYDTLLFTELDSLPATKQWIKSMTSRFTEKKSIVLGFSALFKQKGLIGRFAAFDYLFINIQILGMALLGKPYGANGRNLAYEKKHFNERKGFSKYRFLESGADDLFVNEIAKKDTIGVDVSREGLIQTMWRDSLDWKNWKISRTLTKQYYDSSRTAFWRIESFSRVLFLALTIYLIATEFFSIIIPSIAFGAYLIRLVSQIIVMNKTAKNLSVSSHCAFLPLFDIMQVFYNIYFYIHSLFKSKEGYTSRLGK